MLPKSFISMFEKMISVVLELKQYRMSNSIRRIRSQKCINALFSDFSS